MVEDFLFRRRNRLKHHFVNTSKVLLYGYKSLSDGAKITYQVIDSFDWEDRSTGTAKGYAFPSVGRIAAIRGVSRRTVQRHIDELIKAKLLTRVERVGQTSVLMIEDVAEQEARAYLKTYVEKPVAGGDKTVTPPMTEMSPKIEEEKENENNVNDTFSPLGGVLRERMASLNRQASMSQKRSTHRKVLDNSQLTRREYYAGEILKITGDSKSLGCYRRIAAQCPPEVIFQVLSMVKEASRNGAIRKSRGALFVDLIKRFAARDGLSLGLSLKHQANPTTSNTIGSRVHFLSKG